MKYIVCIVSLLAIVACSDKSSTVSPTNLPELLSVAPSGNLQQGTVSKEGTSEGGCQIIEVDRAAIQVNVDGTTVSVYVPGRSSLGTPYVVAWPNGRNTPPRIVGPINAWFSFTLTPGTYEVRLDVEVIDKGGRLWQCDRSYAVITVNRPAPPTHPKNPPPPPETDVCPNLQGNQPSVPDGYHLNEDGQCVLDQPTDVCPNLEGNQSTVPQGYHLADGQCIPDTPPPTDVCPNLEGVQESVPQGYYLTENGTCQLIPEDVCTNLDGLQTSIPEGYELVDGQCVLIPPPVVHGLCYYNVPGRNGQATCEATPGFVSWEAQNHLCGLIFPGISASEFNLNPGQSDPDCLTKH